MGGDYGKLFQSSMIYFRQTVWDSGYFVTFGLSVV